MGRSHTVHMSNKGHSITNKKKLIAVFCHNLRKYLKNSENYNKELNTILVNLVDSANSFEKYFNKFFEKELLEYNQKQKRNDRKIDNYFKHCCEKNGDVAVELIIQSCDKDYWEKNADKRSAMVNVYKGQLEYLKELMPQLEIVSAVVHNDESSPHLHVVAIPYQNGYKRGLSKQCSKTIVFQGKLEMLQDKMREKGQELMQKYVDKDFEYAEKIQGRNFDFSKSRYIEIYETIKEKVYDKALADAKQQAIKDVKLTQEEKDLAVAERTAEYKATVDESTILARYKQDKYAEYDEDEELQDRIFDDYLNSKDLDYEVQNQILLFEQMKANTELYLKDQLKIAEARKLTQKIYLERTSQAVNLNCYIETSKSLKDLSSEKIDVIKEWITRKIKHIVKSLAQAFDIKANFEENKEKEKYNENKEIKTKNIR